MSGKSINKLGLFAASVCGLLFLAFLVFLSVNLIQNSSANRALQSRLDALAEQGIPYDNASLQTWYESRTDPTDSQEWHELLEFLSSKDFGSMSKGVSVFDTQRENEAWTPINWKYDVVARKLVADTEQQRESIHRLSSKRRPVRLPITIDSVNTLLTDTQRLRNVSRLISVECEVAMSDRDSEKIRRAIQCQLDLALVCSEEPFLVSHLVCIAVRSMGYLNLQTALQHDLLADEDLEILLQQLQTEPLEFYNHRNIVIGERANLLPMFFDVKRYSQRPNNSDVAIKLSALPQDANHFLEFMDRLLEIDMSSIDTAYAESNALDSELMNRLRSMGLWERREWIVSGLVIPATAAYVTALCNEVVMNRQALHALAIRKLQHRNNRFPNSLSELDQVGFDHQQHLPLGGKPMGYRVQETEVILWATSPRDGAQTSDEPPDLNLSSPYSGDRLRYVYRFPNQRRSDEENAIPIDATDKPDNAQ